MKHEVKKFNFSAGSLNTSIPVKFKYTGKVVGIALYINGNEPTENINISIRDDNGRDILEQSHYKDFIRSTGANTYRDSLRPVEFKEREIYVMLSSDSALAADFKGQIQFYIEPEVYGSSNLPKNGGITAGIDLGCQTS